MTALTRLTLTDFRNYESLSLPLDGRHVCLYGSNGAGKTNLLEAVSQLGPGRGLRSATLPEMIRKDALGGWTVSAALANDQRIGVAAHHRLGLRIAQDALRHRGLGGQRESDQQRDESGQSAPQRKVRRDAGEVRDHAGMLAPGGLNVS